MIQDKVDHGDFAGARQVAKDAGIFGDGWTIGMNRDGSPSTRVHAVDGQPKRTLTIEPIPGTMAGAYQEAEYGINVRRHGQSILVQPGVRDYNRMIHADMGLPGTQRERSVKQLQDQRGGLMGAFLNFYEHRQSQLDPNASR
ncbi:MAG TPA: hypothetical protein VFI32_03235, partial [Rhodanobacteraceae bacterium]|nr:hypothetical protein [Rhodanobacteraceae bacterium]